MLAALARLPEWGALRRWAEQAKDARGRHIADLFIRKNQQPDYAQLQWERGVFAGITFLLNTPTVEAAKLERLLANQGEDVTTVV